MQKTHRYKVRTGGWLRLILSDFDEQRAHDPVVDDLNKATAGIRPSHIDNSTFYRIDQCHEGKIVTVRGKDLIDLLEDGITEVTLPDGSAIPVVAKRPLAYERWRGVVT